MDELTSFSESHESNVSFIPTIPTLSNVDSEDHSFICPESKVYVDLDVDSSLPESDETSLSFHLYNIQGIHDHSISQVIGDVITGDSTRRQISSKIFIFLNFVLLIEPKKVDDALNDVNWIRAMQDMLNEFKRHNVWTWVPRPMDKIIIGTRWVFRKKWMRMKLLHETRQDLLDKDSHNWRNHHGDLE